MGVGFERESFKSGNSLVISIPIEWAKDKETIGVILFDLNNNRDHKQYYEFREKMANLH